MYLGYHFATGDQAQHYTIDFEEKSGPDPLGDMLMKVNRQEPCILADFLSISLLISSKTGLMSSKHGDKFFLPDSGR